MRNLAVLYASKVRRVRGRRRYNLYENDLSAPLKVRDTPLGFRQPINTYKQPINTICKVRDTPLGLNETLTPIPHTLLHTLIQTLLSLSLSLSLCGVR
jgi:hypothetical protein